METRRESLVQAPGKDLLSQFNNPVRRDGNPYLLSNSPYLSNASSQFNNPVRRDGNYMKFVFLSHFTLLSGHNSIIPFAGMETLVMLTAKHQRISSHNSIIPFAGMETVIAANAEIACSLSRHNSIIPFAGMETGDQTR